MRRRRPWLPVTLLAVTIALLLIPTAAAQDASGEEEKSRESAHGSYEFKPSYGGGLEVGYFFNDLTRWNDHLLKPNSAPTFDVSGLGGIEGAFEISPTENLRLSAVLGYQMTLGGDPTLGALYGGVEPMLTARQGDVEMGIGITLGGGGASLSADSGDEGTAPFALIRPVIEGRYYLNEVSALYLRLAFEYWLVGDFDSDTLTNRNSSNQVNRTDPEDALGGGHAYVALGVRFGHYPEHVKNIPDTDGDGLRDDVDDCPAEAEDVDNFKDDDGCPEPDNDSDGVCEMYVFDRKIKDSLGATCRSPGVDQCVDQAEDLDGWKDDDGCPEDNDDRDGDGLIDTQDTCPDQAEDFDKFKDEDGCPDLDNDNDGILDGVDKCPDKAEVINGFEDDDGCPDESKITLTDDKIELNEQIFFDTGKDTIKPESFPLLDQIVAVLKSQPRIRKVMIEGHTDDVGDPKKNLDLSKRRAASVVKYLTDQGLNTERFASDGFGSTVPLINPKGLPTAQATEARTQNRRVELKILELAPKEPATTPAPAPAP
jgi:outer membrane protein OmpA-like peptidoglycan-associated protein